MKGKVTLHDIVNDLYKQITVHDSNLTVDYNLFQQTVRKIFADNHDLDESALNASDKVLICTEDAASEKVGIMMELGWIPRDYYKKISLSLGKILRDSI